ncbi:MAG: hypothetical protein JJT90_16170 [Ectothiorhodospiraceae bacterium]|nr:hypothetical protein [Ectothiorhodospiraceae bacterium]
MITRNASIRHLNPEESVDFVNDRGKPVELVLRTEFGTTMRLIVPMGSRVQCLMGRERGALYLLDVEGASGPFRVVPREQRTGSE